jgi:hypothetical protein
MVPNIVIFAVLKRRERQHWPLQLQVERPYLPLIIAVILTHFRLKFSEKQLVKKKTIHGDSLRSGFGWLSYVKAVQSK